MAGVVRAHVGGARASLPLIIGSEFRLEDGLRLVLLATSRRGYGQLCRLITRARRAAEKGSYRLVRDDLARATFPRKRLRPQALLATDTDVSAETSAASPIDLDDCLALWLPGTTPCAADGRWLAGLFPSGCGSRSSC